MKKILILTVIFTLLITSYGLAQMKIGLFGGYNMYLDELPEGASAGGISFGAKLGYGMDNFTLGLLTGYLALYSYEISADFGAFGSMTADTSCSDIPIIVFGQMSFSGVYVLGGLGIHLMSVTSDVSGTGMFSSLSGSTSVSGEELGIALGAGYEMDLGGAGLEIGGLFNMILAEESVNMLTFHAGVNFSL